MLVSKKHNSLIINSPTPNQILSVIPTARSFEYKGHTLIAVPHRMDEVKVLNNMGLNAPSPIETQYDWPGVEKPFDVQRITAGKLTIHPRMYVLNSMGTGKSNAAAWAADYLMSLGRVRSALIVCPLSCIERVWGDTLFAVCPGRRVEVLYGDAARRIKRLDNAADFYVINHHGVKIPSMLAELHARLDIDLVIIDELAEYSNTRSDLWKALDAVVNGERKRGKVVRGARREWVWGLTGTPTPTAPTDAWAQCRLITPDTVPQFFGRFRDTVMRAAGPYRYIAKHDAKDTVYGVMQPSVRFTRDQCLDLPERMWTTRHCEMGAEQTRAYADMMKRLKAEVSDGQLVAMNAAVKALKLAQIACGVAYDVQHNEVVIPSPARIEALREVVQESEGKVIVFVPFTGALNMVADAVSKYATVAVVDGGVSKGNRDRIFDEFQRQTDPRVLVAYAGCMSHGLTLTEANTIVWYGPTNSNRIYTQANDRITRPGQKRQQFIVHFEGSKVERVMYKALLDQGGWQDELLDLFANG